MVNIIGDYIFVAIFKWNVVGAALATVIAQAVSVIMSIVIIRGKNLPDIYYKAMGNKICDFHSDIIEKEVPEYKDYYGKIEFLDSLFGTKCPVCQKLGGKKRG